MNKLILFFTLFFLSLGTINSQKLKTQFSNSIAINADRFFGIDNLGNYYYSKENILFKKNLNNIFQYKNISLNKITSINFTNPLKVIVFYENFNTCILLDAQFNEILRKNFTNELNDAIVTQIGLASNNRLWLFNSLNNSILLYDYTLNTSQTVGQPLTSTIAFSQTNFNTFYWIDEISNLYSCDIFGKTSFMCNVPAYDKIQIIDNERILFLLSNKLYLLNNTAKSIFEIEVVENSLENFYYKDQNLAIFTDQQIKNFKITIP
jgi:hypothetical protein